MRLLDMHPHFQPVPAPAGQHARHFRPGPQVRVPAGAEFDDLVRLPETLLNVSRLNKLTEILELVVLRSRTEDMCVGSQRFFRVEGGFLSAPFVETGATANPSDGCTGEECAPTDAVIPDNLKDLMEELKSLLPPQCRFANYTINIKAVRDDTGIEFLAPIPVCTVRTNWRDY